MRENSIKGVGVGMRQKRKGKERGREIQKREEGRKRGNKRREIGVSY